jgi:AcrR family transcriptional regulator
MKQRHTSREYVSNEKCASVVRRGEAMLRLAEMAPRPRTPAVEARRSPRTALPLPRRATVASTAPRNALTDTLFHAVYRCFVRLGPGKTRVGDVAAAAGVSRRTIYRYFPTRDELLSAYVQWGLDRFEELASARLERLTTFAERMEELAVMARTPQFAFGADLASIGVSDATATFFVGTMHSKPLLRRSIDFLAPYVQEAQRRREVRTDIDAAQAAEWIARVFFSIGELPSVTFDVHDEKALRRFVRRFLIPGLK